jgi:hypothetical protein
LYDQAAQLPSSLLSIFLDLEKSLDPVGKVVTIAKQTPLSFWCSGAVEELALEAILRRIASENNTGSTPWLFHFKREEL